MNARKNVTMLHRFYLARGEKHPQLGSPFIECCQHNGHSHLPALINFVTSYRNELFLSFYSRVKNLGSFDLWLPLGRRNAVFSPLCITK
jgi:hypothetical protein